MPDDRTSRAVAVRVAIRQEFVDVLLEAATADPVTEDGDFLRLSLRLLVGLPVEVGETCADNDENEDAGDNTADCAGAKGE